MSDNFYSRDLKNDSDIDLWQMSFARNDPNIQKRKVEFDVRQRLGETSETTRKHVFNPSVRDISEPEMKISIIVLESINGFTQYFLTHPFVVIRRQTQVLFAIILTLNLIVVWFDWKVNRKSLYYHLTPLTVIPFVVRVQSKQGLAVLWKGITSVFITKAIQIGFESIISELTPFERYSLNTQTKRDFTYVSICFIEI